MPRKRGTPNTPQITIDKIIQQHASGKSVKELAIKYNKPYKTIKNMITRENRKKDKRAEGTLPKQRGRKPAVTLQDYKYECKRLKMENELLRDFLYLAGRR